MKSLVESLLGPADDILRSVDIEYWLKKLGKDNYSYFYSSFLYDLCNNFHKGLTKEESIDLALTYNWNIDEDNGDVTLSNKEVIPGDIFYAIVNHIAQNVEVYFTDIFANQVDYHNVLKFYTFLKEDKKYKEEAVKCLGPVFPKQLRDIKSATYLKVAPYPVEDLIYFAFSKESRGRVSDLIFYNIFEEGDGNKQIQKLLK